MKIVVGAFAALIVLTTGAALNRYPITTSLETDELTTGSIPAAGTPSDGELTLRGQGGSCTIFKGPALGGGLNELFIPVECNALMPDLSAMRFWKENSDGSVAFSTDGAKDLVLFSAGDGAAYESYRPSRPMLSLTE